MSDPNIYQGSGKGGTQIALVNLVPLGVDNTGATDAGVQINTALAAMTSAAHSAGQSAMLPNGSYLLTTAIVNPNNVPILIAPKAKFSGANAASITNAILFGPVGVAAFVDKINLRSSFFAGGAKFDGQIVSDGAMLVTSHTLSSASNPFVAADVGKLIQVAGAGAGGIPLVTTIAAFVGAGSVTLTAPAVTGVAGAQVVWGTDDAPAWQAAVIALSGSGIGVFADHGISIIGEPVQMESFTNIYGTSDVSIVQLLTGSGNVSAFNGTSALGATGTVTAVNTPGTKVIQSSMNVPAGTWIWADSALGGGGNIYLVQGSSAAGGNWNLAVDRPVQWLFAIGDTITRIADLIQEVRIFGGGMGFSGSSQGTVQGFIGFGYAYRCFIYDCQMGGGIAGGNTSVEVAFNFDIGCLECEGARLRVNGGGTLGVGIALQSAERCYFRGCEIENCAGAATFFDCIDCGIEADTFGNTIAASFSSGVGASVTGTQRCWYRGKSSGDGIGVNFGFSSSYNKVDVTIDYPTNIGVSIGNTNGPCLANEINAVVYRCTEATGAGAAFYISGNGHTVKCPSLTMTLSAARSLIVQGAGCRVIIDNLVSYDFGTTGGWSLVNVNGASDIIVKGGYIANTKTLPSTWSGFVATGGGTIEVDDVVGEILGGATTSEFIFGNLGVGSYRIRNCRLYGTWTSGVQSNGGQANIFRILEGNDFTPATYPIIVDGSAKMNRGNVTTTTAISFPLNSAESITLQPNAATSAAYISSRTNGTGFTVTCAASTDYFVN